MRARQPDQRSPGDGRLREPKPSLTAVVTPLLLKENKLVGQKTPLKVKDIWAIRVRLQMQGRSRDLAMFD